MLSYIVKRLALMVPTLFGVLLLTFVVIQFVPGGPVEQVMAAGEPEIRHTITPRRGFIYTTAR